MEGSINPIEKGVENGGDNTHRFQAEQEEGATAGRKGIKNAKKKSRKKRSVLRGIPPLPLRATRMISTMRGNRQGSTHSRGISASLCSNSSSNISWRNCLVDKKKPSVMAREVWDFGKTVGLQCKAPDEEVVRRLEEMENRDKLAAGGGHSGDGVRVRLVLLLGSESG